MSIWNFEQAKKYANNLIEMNGKPICREYYSGPIVSFTSDDGKIETYTKFKPIFEAERVPCNICLITNSVGTDGFMTLEQIQEVKSLGWTVASHTQTHLNASTATPEELDTEYKAASEYLRANGLDHDILVYPYGVVTDQAIATARKYYKMAVNIVGNPADNSLPNVSNYNMKRVAGLSQPRGAGPSLASIKSVIDSLSITNYWLIFEDHAHYADWTEDLLDDLQELIQYIKSKNIPIVNLQDGFNMRCNIIDREDYIMPRNDFGLQINNLISSYTNAMRNNFILIEFLYNLNGIISADTFSRTDAISSLGITDTGDTWEIIKGIWGVSGGWAYKSTSNSTGIACIDSGLSDVKVSVKIARIGIQVGLALRCIDYDNTIRVYVDTTNDNKLTAGKRISEVSSTLQVGSVVQDGDIIKVIMNGSTIEFYINDVLDFSITETDNQTETKHGLFCGSVYETSARWDDFFIEKLT